MLSLQISKDRLLRFVFNVQSAFTNCHIVFRITTSIIVCRVIVIFSLPTFDAVWELTLANVFPHSVTWAVQNLCYSAFVKVSPKFLKENTQFQCSQILNKVYALDNISLEKNIGIISS